MRRLFALVMVTLAALAGPAQGRDQLTIGISQYPATLHPAFDSMLAKTYVLGFVQRPVTAFDADWQLVCLLCESLPTLENGGAVIERRPDGGRGVAVTYRLKEGAAWDDGTPVSADDIRFAWEVGRHPRSGVANGELYRRILAIDTPDRRTAIVHFDRLTFDYNAINDLRPLPAHIERPRFEADPEAYHTATAYDREPTRPGLYDGPYRIVERVAGSHLVLERNPAWVGPPPAFRRIVIRAIENSAALEANLRAGGVDMIAGELGLPLEQALPLERRLGGRVTVLTRPGLAYEHLDVNLDSPILADRRVRRALLAGLDRALITRALYDDRQPVAAAQVAPGDRMFDPTLTPQPYDPALAARLLDEAGWTVGPGGIRRDGQGAPLALDLVTTAGNRTRELLAQVLQSQWRAIGVLLSVHTAPPRVLFGETVTKRRFPHFALFSWYSAPESVPRSELHSTMIPTEANGWSGQNYTGYRSPEMDRLIDAIETETDPTKRLGLWAAQQRLYAEDLPVLPLFFRADAFVLPAGFTGLRPTGHQDPTTLWVEDWRWD